MDFLDKHYETEHLENIIYVIEDMDNILKRNGGSLEWFYTTNTQTNKNFTNKIYFLWFIMLAK